MFMDLTLAVLISRLIALLIGTTLHEYGHNYVGYLMGDNTPAYQGRLTLDPRKHIYWPGFLMFVVVGFGVLGTAPVSPAGMSMPRAGWARTLNRQQRFGIAVLSGPLGNLLVAAVAALLIRLIGATTPGILGPIDNNQLARIIPSLGMILFDLVWWNVLLFIFNLIPLGPLDGRYILQMFIPPQHQYTYDNLQTRYGMFALFGLILLSFAMPGFNLLGNLIGQPTVQLTRLLVGARSLTAIYFGV
ncbi:MAG: site-2 protease family protein [Anaerolineae bacterium]